MEAKKVQSYKRRIKAAQSTLSCMGAVMLQMEVDNMTLEQRLELKAALQVGRSPITYAYLEQKIGA